MLRLEQLSYYHHLSLTSAGQRPIFAYRIVDIRGSRFHVLTRLQDAGLDFTGRSNFTAHHLVFAPEEIPQLPAPSVILRDWSGWLGTWTKDPQLLSNESWGNLGLLAEVVSVPSRTWERLTGDAANGYALLEAKNGIAINADGIDETQILSLISESVQLLEVRDSNKDRRGAAWQYTFTTSTQEQDTSPDFRWRFLHSDNPAFAKLGAECRSLSSLRPNRCTDEEIALAKAGRKKPNFLIQPQDVRTVEGQPIKIEVSADGVPKPQYEWYEVDRAGNAKGLVGHSPELVLASPALGVSRYVVRASNSAGEIVSRPAIVSVNPKARLQREEPSVLTVTPRSKPGYIKTAEDIERQRNRLEQQKAEAMFRRRRKLKVTVGIFASTIAVGLAGFGGWRAWLHAKPPTHINRAESNSSSNTAFTNIVSDLESASGPSSTGSKQMVESYSTWPPQWRVAAVGDIDESVTKTNYLEGVFLLTGTGRPPTEGRDNFFFVYQSVSNWTSFSARISQVGPESAYTLCGIMCRQTEKADAPFAFIGSSVPDVQCLSRVTAGRKPDLTMRPRGKSSAIFLHLVRNQSNIAAGFSTNNATWIWVTNRIEVESREPLLGFALCSGKSNAPIRAYFDNVIIDEVKQ